ncbi:hypothetical protein SAMN06265360_1781, partial [Haloechinothrix alba]
QGRGRPARDLAQAPHPLHLLTRPDKLTDHQRERIDATTGACPEMTGLAALVGDFAALLAPVAGNDERLTRWIDQARAEDLPHLHAFTRGSSSTATPWRRPHPYIPQWTNRRTEHQNEDDQTADVRPGRLPPPPPPHTARPTLPNVTTKYTPEPGNVLVGVRSHGRRSMSVLVRADTNQHHRRQPPFSHGRGRGIRGRQSDFENQGGLAAHASVE